MTEAIEDDYKALVSDDGAFIYNAPDEEIDEATLYRFIKYHIENPSQRGRFKRLKNYYKGKHDYANFALNPRKDEGKPDARMTINYPAELVDNMGGFFVGTPPTITYNADNGSELQDKLSNFLKMNHADSIISELSKQSDIFGRSYLLIYQDEYKDTRLAVSSPIDTFVIYDNSIQMKPICGVRYQRIDGAVAHTTGTVYYPNREIDFMGDELSSAVALDEPIEYEYDFGGVPLIEFVNNDERIGVFEPVMSVIDQIDESFNHKANDINYFANEILKMVGVNIDQEQINGMINNRILVVKGQPDTDVDISFLDKPNADALQENFLNRADSYIYTKSGVANYNDDVFGQASGTALEFKLQAMTNKAKTKQRIFKKGLLDMLAMAFAVGGTLPLVAKEENIISDIEITFTTTVPHNISDEAQTAQTLLGVTDEKTALGTLSFVNDPQSVIDAKREEEADRASRVASQMGVEDEE